MSFILLVEQAAPETPSANQVVLYPKSDGLIYSKDDAGTESVIASGAATQAQQEQGTSTSVFTSPLRQQFHPSAAKFWLAWLTSTTALSASYNVNSVTNTGVGNETVTIETDFSTSSWAGFATANQVNAFTIGHVASKTVGTVQVLFVDNAQNAVDVQGNVMGFGDQ